MMRSNAPSSDRPVVSNLLRAFVSAALFLCGCVMAAPDAGSDESSLARSLRKEIEGAYERMHEALRSGDPTRVMALRTDNIEAILPDGTVRDSRQMNEATENLLENVQEWIAMSDDILNLEASGYEVGATVRQHSIRMMRRPDGVRRVENWVVQRETWVKTPDGWRMRRVDDIRDQCVLVDGRLRDDSMRDACHTQWSATGQAELIESLLSGDGAPR
jgi:ketosteroid isomerase-like protein